MTDRSVIKKVVPRKPEQNRDIRENRRKQIMVIALEMFADKGYSNSSIRSISKKAGISKGLIYNYFSSKEELLGCIVNEGMAEMFNLLDNNKDGELTRDEFIYFIKETFQLMKKDIFFWKLYFSLMMQPSVWKIFEEKFQDIITPYISMMTGYFKQKKVADPETEAVLVGTLLDGIGFNYVFNPDGFPLDKVVDNLIKRFV